MGKSKIYGGSAFKIKGVDRTLTVLPGNIVEKGDFIKYGVTGNTYYTAITPKLSTYQTGQNTPMDSVLLPDGRMLLFGWYYSSGYRLDAALVSFGDDDAPSIVSHITLITSALTVGDVKAELMPNGNIAVAICYPPNGSSKYTTLIILKVSDDVISTLANSIVDIESPASFYNVGLIVLSDTHFVVISTGTGFVFEYNGTSFKKLSTKTGFVLCNYYYKIRKLDENHYICFSNYINIIEISDDYVLTRLSSVNISKTEYGVHQFNNNRYLLAPDSNRGFYYVDIDSAYNVVVTPLETEAHASLTYESMYFDEDNSTAICWRRADCAQYLISEEKAILLGYFADSGYVIRVVPRPLADNKCQTIGMMSINNHPTVGSYYGWAYNCFNTGVYQSFDSPVGVSLQKGTEKVKTTCIF